MTKRPGLGRGLDSLIPGTEASTIPASGVTQLPASAITRNPHQPRTRFDPTELDELSASIREHGILQPLLVTSGPTPELYTLIAGERRLLAARQAGLATVPVIIREASPQELVELALIENVQRADLGALETAEAYLHLAEDFGLSHEAIAERVGKSRVTVTNTLRLLKLPETARNALANRQISEGHARALLTLSTSQAQVAALHSIIQNELSVRQTEELVRRMSGEKRPSKPRSQPAPEVTDLEARLRASLGTKVNLKRSRKGGTVVIHYYSDEELDALVNKIAGE
ncbi:MAG: ParB/RepB/Spo0J family partition protein [Chloroflexota bacterium]